ncbi:tRNA lysidine(34) synthetase [Ornithinimicrobium pratense]|uniref:tRNA(Ile)-lysidine synthase n=1 Tax=Ornithinimicrobium pratense TaxID=2593973 RepID=A0A5J6V1U5_9MICO|nr:tRNA lysidine(34) synthetase [Ornithinimicrobium pratense]QFG67615.1 tRNA lysidine(34) synthetase TilS [Ornithinimicrobium pratense]
MPGPPPAIAACRVAVRRWLTEERFPEGALVLVGCSGGADSLALLAATAFVAPRAGLRVGTVIVDHGLQPGSSRVADSVAVTAYSLLTEQGPVEVVGAQVEQTGAGPEADARRARYAAFGRTADRLGAMALLLGHTLDDQAEQVLLGLARGSGARSLAGMPRSRVLSDHSACSVGTCDVFGEDFARVLSGRMACPVGGGSESEGGGRVVLGRPLLGVSRAQTQDACAELGLVPWQDPHNEDPRFARVRVRRALADLEKDLGPGLGRNLARTAALLRDDADALDEACEAAYRELGDPPWTVGRLASLPRALRTRLWRRLALAAGSPGTDLTSEHLLAVDGLVTAWRGQGPLSLPGGVRAWRQGDRVRLERRRS